MVSRNTVFHTNWWLCWNIWISHWENRCVVIWLIADSWSTWRATFSLLSREEGLVGKAAQKQPELMNFASFCWGIQKFHVYVCLSLVLLASSDDMTLTSPSMDNSSAELIPGGDSPLNKRMTENLLASLLEHEREAILNVPAAQNPEDLRMFARWAGQDATTAPYPLAWWKGWCGVWANPVSLGIWRRNSFGFAPIFQL